MSAAVIAAAAVRRAERRVIERLRSLGAISHNAARPLTDLRWIEGRRLRRMLAAGAIRETTPGTYYLDESALGEYQQRRRKRVLAFLGALLVGALSVFGLRRR